jgi:Pentapeptide repeats (8 copies)
MAFRVLFVVALAFLNGCEREGTPVGAKEPGVEGSAPSSEPSPDQRSQDALLQAYFDQMSVLLLDKGLDGWVDGGAKDNREVRALARTRTLAVLERLDPARKRLVVLFLMEASLIQNAPGGEPVIGLVGADLGGVDLAYSAAGDAEPYASVPVPDLSGADLTYADLSGANLGVVMHGTRLVGADLRGADFSGTTLYDANLSGANLSGATGKTAEQLEGQTSSLQGAIMPDGRKYEDWLEGKGGEKGAEEPGSK